MIESVAILLSVAGKKTHEVYQAVVDLLDQSLSHNQIVVRGYSLYLQQEGNIDRTVSGKVFENLIVDALHHAGIRPIYCQAIVANVPNVIFDILLYHPQGPVAISCKTSLRERWKQADLEGAALKQVYRRGRSVLITLDKKMGTTVQKKIAQGDVFGLDQCIVIEENNEAFDKFIEELQQQEFIKAKSILPVKGKLPQEPI